MKSFCRFVVAAALLAGVLAACDSPANDAGLSALNADRASHAVPTVGLDQMLQTKAQQWAEHLAAQGVLSHSTLTNGIVGCWRSLGENVGYGSSIDTVEGAYMQSPPHRANILDSNYRAAAVGVAWRGNLVFTVQEFLQPC